MTTFYFSASKFKASPIQKLLTILNAQNAASHRKKYAIKYCLKQLWMRFPNSIFLSNSNYDLNLVTFSACFFKSTELYSPGGILFK